MSLELERVWVVYAFSSGSKIAWNRSNSILAGYYLRLCHIVVVFETKTNNKLHTYSQNRKPKSKCFLPDFTLRVNYYSISKVLNPNLIFQTWLPSSTPTQNKRVESKLLGNVILSKAKLFCHRNTPKGSLLKKSHNSKGYSLKRTSYRFIAHIR